MAKKQPRLAKLGGDQFLQANGRGGLSFGKFGHESDSSLFHPMADRFSLVDVKVQSDRAVDGLARLTGRQDRQRAEPLGGEHQHGVDVFALHQHVVAIDGLGVKFGCRLLGPMPHRIAHRTDFKAIGQRTQGGSMSHLPDVAKADQAKSDFHGRPPPSTISAPPFSFTILPFLPHFTTLGNHRSTTRGVRKKARFLQPANFTRPLLAISFDPVTLG